MLSLARQWEGWYQLEAASQGQPLQVEPSHVEVRVEGPPVFSSQEDQEDQEEQEGQEEEQEEQEDVSMNERSMTCYQEDERGTSFSC